MLLFARGTRFGGIGFSTNPQAHWTDHGHKTFNVIGRPKQEMLRLAMVWAEQRYGIGEWIRDSFGDYQDGRVLIAVRQKLNLGGGGRFQDCSQARCSRARRLNEVGTRRVRERDLQKV